MWKITFGLFLAASIFFLCSAAVLATTVHSLDVSIHDRYRVILPSHLLILAAILLVATFAVWKAKVSH
jgi:hypothetical protein